MQFHQKIWKDNFWTLSKIAPFSWKGWVTSSKTSTQNGLSAVAKSSFRPTVVVGNKKLNFIYPPFKTQLSNLQSLTNESGGVWLTVCFCTISGMIPHSSHFFAIRRGCVMNCSNFIILHCFYESSDICVVHTTLKTLDSQRIHI